MIDNPFTKVISRDLSEKYVNPQDLGFDNISVL